MKFIPIIIYAAVLAAVNIFAFKAGADVESYRAETISDFFTGSVIDWVGLIGFNLSLVVNCIASYKEWLVFNEVGSSGKTIIIGFAIPLALFLLIYLA